MPPLPAKPGPPESVLPVPREAAGERLDRFLARALALPPARARELIEAGQARIRGKSCSPLRKLFGGEQIELSRPTPAPEAARGPALPALYDDPDCLVVDKPAGLPVEPEGREGEAVVTAARRLGTFSVDGKASPGLPHRLDRETSGALLLARHDRALAALRAAFAAGQVEKDYLVLVAGEPTVEGRLDTPYGRDPADPRRFTTRWPSPRRARLSWRVEQRLRGSSLLAVRLETGRTHQIRVQLAEAGHPVLGDPVYGQPSPAIARQALHARRLAFPPPSGKGRIEVRSPLPRDLEAALDLLGRR